MFEGENGDKKPPCWYFRGKDMFTYSLSRSLNRWSPDAGVVLQLDDAWEWLVGLKLAPPAAATKGAKGGKGKGKSSSKKNDSPVVTNESNCTFTKGEHIPDAEGGVTETADQDEKPAAAGEKYWFCNLCTIGGSLWKSPISAFLITVFSRLRSDFIFAPPINARAQSKG